MVLLLPIEEEMCCNMQHVCLHLTITALDQVVIQTFEAFGQRQTSLIWCYVFKQHSIRSQLQRER